MIRFIVVTVSSLTDTNGNRYHFARVTSTRTGRSMVLDHVCGDSNAVRLIKSALDLDWSEVYSLQYHESKRDWQRMRKYAVGDVSLYEHNVTAKMLRDLERAACVECGAPLYGRHVCK